MNDDKITYFGQTDARNKKVTFGIKAKDRTKHVYVIGKTGMGKSTLLENMAVQDIKNGEGMAFIDPHGKTAELLLEYVPEHRQKDVIYFAPFDMDNPIAFNVLEKVEPDKRHLVVSGLMSTFKKIWQDAWSARMEYILTNTLLALLECPDATLLGVNRMLSDKSYRNHVISFITDASVKAFWTQEFANYTERMALEAVPAIQNKIGQFTANALIRNMIGQPKTSFDIRKIMDEGKIMIINLSKGRIGESNANLLGGMMITKIYLAALSRADVPDRVLKTLPNFYLFVDEFQSFANESFADILSEARKYKLNLTIAHQYIEQMEDEVRAAVFGNVGTMIVFRVGAYDAEILEKEFTPQFTAEDIVNLGIYQIYLKLMIDGISSQPFSATTLPPIPKPESSSMTSVIETSRKQFSHPRTEVEKQIEEWMVPINKPQHKEYKEKGRMEIPQQVKPATNIIKENRVEPAPMSISTPPPPPAPNKEPVAMSQPFKKAFSEVKMESATQQNIPRPTPQPASPPKPISLDALNIKNKPKEAQPQRVNELKNALASILGSNTQNIEKKKVIPEKIEEKVETVNNKELKKENNINEIPEDRLNEVLKVD